ncbi:hypothetical protein [Nocardia sp. NBC_01327]|uniref:hypothetical protein n=1 Tax=Nocardia sp. NBC_01327 TaxID=2903593 RepID=UPI002E1652FA|nr:hypothetical protein OG326_21020 [Nocardia sp. NBC_01327]
MNAVAEELAKRLATEGFRPSGALDDIPDEQPGRRYPTWKRVWFTAPVVSVQGLTSVLLVVLQWDGSRGGLSLNAHAQMVSDTVATVLRDMPTGALPIDAEDEGDRWQPHYLESVSFGFFYSEFDPSSQKIWLAGESDVVEALDRFMSMLHGPVHSWLSERDSVDKLFELAHRPSTMGGDQSNPDPIRLRGIVVLAISNGRASDAATLTEWYLRRARFTGADTIERVSAFNTAMREQFTDYALTPPPTN